MKCPRCEQDNPSHAKFCLGCGVRLMLACGSCGTELPAGARFCLQCGQAVGAGTAAAVSSPAPEAYTPRHLAEKILLIARCHSGLGKVYRRVGRREEARQSYTTSAEMYRRMNARISKEQVEAEIVAMN